jgi:preprotein translocase subunit SecB
MLSPIDFAALYQQRMMQVQQESEAGGEVEPGEGEDTAAKEN